MLLCSQGVRANISRDACVDNRGIECVCIDRGFSPTNEAVGLDTRARWVVVLSSAVLMCSFGAPAAASRSFSVVCFSYVLGFMVCYWSHGTHVLIEISQLKAIVHDCMLVVV